MQHRGIEHNGKIWKEESEVTEALANGLITKDDYYWILEGLQKEQWKKDISARFALSDLAMMHMTEENIYFIWTEMNRAKAYEEIVDKYWELYKWIQSMPEMG